MTAPALWTIPAGTPFLDALATRWLAQHGDNPLGGGLILLPTRRAARSLAEAFLRATDGKPLILPRISAIAAAEETSLLQSATALALPPAMPEGERLATLCRLIIALEQASGTLQPSLDATWRLARELAALMDEAARAEIPLAQALAASVPEELAAHWQKTLTFLAIATEQWPRILAERGMMDAASRQVRLLHAQAESWEAAPPAHPVWIAGVTAFRPALGHLARVVAHLPQGAVIFQGLDRQMPDAAWRALTPSHPQTGMQRLLGAIGARRDEVRLWDERKPPSGREDLLARALLPAVALDHWREPTPLDLGGLYRLAAADQQQEALAIATILRDTLETPGARATLITPDRVLAARVAAELRRFGVIADDSAGEPLIETPHAALLRLLAQAVAERLAPVPLLSLLKHPFMAAGLSPGAARAAARALERHCLRGPRPPAGLTGLRQAVAAARGEVPAAVADLLDRVETALLPLLRVAEGTFAQAPTVLMDALVESAEAIATTADSSGTERLWSGEEGEALAAALAELRPALALLPDTPPRVLPGLLDAVLEGKVVRSRRAIRGGAEGTTLHPRIFIWGLVEARLLSADVVILGGLVEGSWPPLPDPGPWLSRRMRAEAGLPSPEEEIGQAAHDFMAGACGAPTVILSAPRRLGGAPAVPARWLTRLEAMLAGQGLSLPLHPAAAWAAGIDQPAGPPVPARPPAPRPALHLRPRRLSITEIETWLADPYAIYARHVLRLRELDPLDQATDAADYGRLVHAGVQRFLEEAGAEWRPDSPQRLRIAMEQALGAARLRPALANWWRPRLLRIAAWIAAVESERRAALQLRAIGTEVAGDWPLAAPGGVFRLTGRADRIERRADGSLGLIDYKTGTVPQKSRVKDGHAPQLPLTAAMAAAGGFGPDYMGPTVEMAYWRLRGGADPGEVITPIESAAEIAELVTQAEASLRRLIADFDQPARPYLARPHPGRAARDSAYGRLARMAEWAGATGDGGGDGA
ncbi:double-strand break repair protein AddB [Acidisoma sp. 7E03]